MYPDFYSIDNKIVLDTKYKKCEKEQRKDIYQVLSYALITGSTHCGLIFPPAEKKGDNDKTENNEIPPRTIDVKNGYGTPKVIKWHSIAFSELKGEIVGFMQKQEEKLRKVIGCMK